ncbi:aminoacyl-tRNA hydrolase [Candidatus Daviesbacteria bacterium]|nr:aminoacyl-tRNA hydrolase [Candidatus Daviesbacteria bacterium]
MKLIVGLGNPGKEYTKTRHNLGFRVVDELGKKVEDGRWKMEKKFKSQILRSAQNDNLILVKPQTYMNNSGSAIKALAAYYKLPTADLIVIHDDLDLPLGKIQIRQGGAAAGHHGVESVIKAMGTDQFIRIRLGIGPSAGESDRFVLEPFTKDEENKVRDMIGKSVEAVALLLEKGLETAQNQFNRQ